MATPKPDSYSNIPNLLPKTELFDTLIAYKFAKMLQTPWKEMDAYKLGIIDANGKILKKRSTLKTPEEKQAYPSVFYTLCWNVKRYLDRIPEIKANLKANPKELVPLIMLMRECCQDDLSDPLLADSMVKEAFLSKGIVLDVLAEESEGPTHLSAGTYVIRGRRVALEADLMPIDECLGHPVFKAAGLYFIVSEARKVEEDAPVNAVGGGAIAGASPGQEPPGPKGGFAGRMRLRRKKKSPQIPPMDGWPK